MGYESHLQDVLTRMRMADRKGLIAAAQVYVNAVKRELRGGYTTGDYVTGNVLNSVTRTEEGPPAKHYEDNDGAIQTTPTVSPEPTGDGQAITVGTNLDYALFWELGWSPRMDHDIAALAGGTIASPSFRVPIWYPQFVAQAGAMRRAFERVHKRAMAA